MRCRAVEYDAHPPTITGRSNSAMNFFRFSGSLRVDTCSAETTVPWTTRMSSSAWSTSGAYLSVRCGVSEAAATTPASLISPIRLTISSSLMGSW